MGYVSESKYVQTVIPSNVWKALKLEGMEEGKTLQEVVRRVLVTYIKEKENKNG